MFKTVNFNIFDENLQDIVYGEKRASQTEENNPADKNIKRKTQNTTEIIIKPLNDKSFERERDRI